MKVPAGNKMISGGFIYNVWLKGKSKGSCTWDRKQEREKLPESKRTESEVDWAV